MRYSIFRKSDGIIVDHKESGADQIALNVPSDCGYVLDHHDYLSRCVDVGNYDAVQAQIDALRADLAKLPPDPAALFPWMEGKVKAPNPNPDKGSRDYLEAQIAALMLSLVVDYVPTQPSPDSEWNATTKRWQLTAAVQAKNAAAALAKAQIAKLEEQQARPLRELMLDNSNATAKATLTAIDTQIAALRPAL